MLRLPPPAESWALPFGSLLNQRGLALPALLLTPALQAAIVVGLVSAALAVALWLRAGRTNGLAFLAIGVLPGLAALWLVLPVSVEMPRMGKFNLEGGLVILPEFMALVLGLVTYTAAYIGEIVRAGIQSVSLGQRQAAYALGLSPRETLRQVIVPQALRAIIPPLTNQYVNLAKNSSLAVAVGYPDLVSVFAGTILNHTNQAVETIAITMAVYLAISLALAAGMNAFNARVALVGR
jgi:general L-amino acid transport system permease protein